MGRLYVGHYSMGHLLKLRFHAKNRIVYSHTSQTFTDFREPCSHHPDGGCTLFSVLCTLLHNLCNQVNKLKNQLIKLILRILCPV